MRVEACKAGKNVHVEKPTCTTIAQLKVMIPAAHLYAEVELDRTPIRSIPIRPPAEALARLPVTHPCAFNLQSTGNTRAGFPFGHHTGDCSLRSGSGGPKRKKVEGLYDFGESAAAARHAGPAQTDRIGNFVMST